MGNKLLTCTVCGKDIRKNAKICPGCGQPQKKKTSPVAWILLVLIILGVIGAISNQSPKSAPTPKRCTMKPYSYVAETKADLDLGTALAVQKDEAAFAKLFADGRLRKSRPNTPVTQMSGGAFGAAKVRYTGETTVYWTDAEFIVCE